MLVERNNIGLPPCHARGLPRDRQHVLPRAPGRLPRLPRARGGQRGERGDCAGSGCGHATQPASARVRFAIAAHTRGHGRVRVSPDAERTRRQPRARGARCATLDACARRSLHVPPCARSSSVSWPRSADSSPQAAHETPPSRSS